METGLQWCDVIKSCHQVTPVSIADQQDKDRTLPTTSVHAALSYRHSPPSRVTVTLTFHPQIHVVLGHLKVIPYTQV